LHFIIKTKKQAFAPVLPYMAWLLFKFAAIKTSSSKGVNTPPSFFAKKNTQH